MPICAMLKFHIVNFRCKTFFQFLMRILHSSRSRGGAEGSYVYIPEKHIQQMCHSLPLAIHAWNVLTFQPGVHSLPLYVYRAVPQRHTLTIAVMRLIMFRYTCLPCMQLWHTGCSCAHLFQLCLPFSLSLNQLLLQYLTHEAITCNCMEDPSWREETTLHTITTNTPKCFMAKYLIRGHFCNLLW